MSADQIDQIRWGVSLIEAIEVESCLRADLIRHNQTRSRKELSDDRGVTGCDWV